MRLVPITDWAVKARMPVKGEEQHGTIVVMGEDVNHGMNHATEDEGQPPVSACADFVHEAPEQDCINDECCWRVQEIMRGNPPGVVEIGWMNDFLHHAAGVLLKHKAIIRQRSPRKQTKRQVGQNRTPQERGLGKFVFCTKFFLDGGVDNEVSGDCVQSVFKASNNSSTDGLSVGSWLGWTRRKMPFVSTMKSPPSWEVSSPCAS